MNLINTAVENFFYAMDQCFFPEEEETTIVMEIESSSEEDLQSSSSVKFHDKEHHYLIPTRKEIARTPYHTNLWWSDRECSHFELHKAVKYVDEALKIAGSIHQKSDCVQASYLRGLAFVRLKAFYQPGFEERIFNCLKNIPIKTYLRSKETQVGIVLNTLNSSELAAAAATDNAIL